MIIYRDFVSNDEVLSDAFPMKEIDDIAYEFEGKLIKIEGGIDDNLIGGNASAEGGEEEGAEDTSETKINILHSHNLVETSFGKKDFVKYMSKYMKKIMTRLQEENPDRVDIFKAKSQEFFKDVVLKNFSEWQFFGGESMHDEGLILLMGYREDGMTPYFVVFKDALIEEKM